jgi:multicomponent Na+:H+ antiporter subunit E
MSRFRSVLALLLVYLALTGNLALNNIIAGLLVSLGVVALLRPEPYPVSIRQMGVGLVIIVYYVISLLWDILLSGIQVALIVFNPRLPIRQGIVAIPSLARSDVGAALSAHSITLTPGELVVELDDERVMYTHCLDAVRTAEQGTNAQERRLAMLDKIFP